jgi:2-keto-3-deoxy-6-phosphogluconate aldolase
VESALRDGWSKIIKALKIIPGEIVIPERYRKCDSHPKPAVVVYFVGGVTYG